MDEKELQELRRLVVKYRKALAEIALNLQPRKAAKIAAEALGE